MRKSSIDPDDGVGELVARLPRAARVLDRYRIDYCCDGKQSVRDACAASHVELAEVLAQLGQVERATPSRGEESFADAPLAELIRYVVDTFHDPLRAELPRLSGLLTKVRAVHERRHPELIAKLNEQFHALRGELLPHLDREERVLFPYVLRLEEARANGAAPRRPAFGTLANPVRVIEDDHSGVARRLREIRRLTEDFTPPEGACATFRSLYAGLEGLERDLIRHIHLENNVLHPRALVLEGERVVSVPA